MRANTQIQVTPQFRVLSDDQIQEVYHAALDVLERAGTRIYGAEALARIPSWLVKDALNTTPGRMVVAGRDRSKRITLEKNRFHFVTGSDCPSMVDPCTDEVRRWTRHV